MIRCALGHPGIVLVNHWIEGREALHLPWTLVPLQQDLLCV